MRVWAGALSCALLTAVCAEAATVSEKPADFGPAVSRETVFKDALDGPHGRPGPVAAFGAPADSGEGATRFGGATVLSDGERLFLSVGVINDREGVVTPTGDGAVAKMPKRGAFASVGDAGARRVVAVLGASGPVDIENAALQAEGRSAALGWTAQAPLPTSALLFVAALGGLVLLSFRRARDAN